MEFLEADFERYVELTGQFPQGSGGFTLGSGRDFWESFTRSGGIARTEKGAIKSLVQRQPVSALDPSCAMDRAVLMKTLPKFHGARG